METLQEWSTIILLGLAVGSVSMTISEAKIFATVRRRIKGKSLWLFNLISCGYCVSHWLALLGVLIFQPVVVVVPFQVSELPWLLASGLELLKTVISLLASAFGIVAISALVQILIAQEFDRKVALAQREQELIAKRLERQRGRAPDSQPHAVA